MLDETENIYHDKASIMPNHSAHLEMFLIDARHIFELRADVSRTSVIITYYTEI
jgi:hypothetical protein